jgi:dihydrolipoamide dehydrogenase
MSENSYDVIVIGSGPGGYVCAIRAAQLGLKTACAEKESTLGGTCLNIGCIPSKALLQASKKFAETQSGLATLGILTSDVRLNLLQMIAYKDRIVRDNVAGIEFLFKKNKVDLLKGTARLIGKNSVEITREGKTDTYSAHHIVIATGSDIRPLQGIKIDEQQIISSTGALKLSKVPLHLVVIGGGYIGLEMGSVWSRLGAKVTVIEFFDHILSDMDREVSNQMQRLLSQQGIAFKLGAKVVGTEAKEDGITLSLEPSQGGKITEIKAEIVLVSVGRKPYTEGLGLRELCLALDESGHIWTDGRFETSVKGIYAIGDVINGPMLAHKAEDEGVAVAELLAGQSGHVNYDTIPKVVYTSPEASSVGLTEDQLKKNRTAYRIGRFPFSANGRARAMNATDGFVKILADAQSDRVLGVHIIGPEAGTIIAECVLAMEFGASAEDIARTCHAHPTLSEVIKEAALAVDGRPIHI